MAEPSPVAKERLETKGLGQTKPTQPNDSEAWRAANRRVEIAAI
jgi:outer membrane protein OmpA-like peptidoglycan-associated protein